MEYNKEDKTAEGDKVSWNMADNLMREIGEHLGEANKLLVEGYPSSLQLAFREMVGVKRRIIQSLNPKTERITLARKEKRIKNILGGFNYFNRLNKHYTTKTNSTTRKATYYLNQLRVRLEEYNELLMDMLESHGYLIAKQKDTKSVM